MGRYEDPLREIESLRQQLATAQDALENEQAKGIHSCHANCTMDGCVNRKLREQLSAAMAACKLKDRALSKLQRDTGLVVLMRPDQVETIANALLVQPDDSALKAWLGEPVGIIEFGGFWLNENNEVKVQDGTPLYAPKGMK